MSEERFDVYKDEADEWRWRLVAGNGEIIADSAEGFDTSGNAMRSIETLLEIVMVATVRKI